MQSSTMLMIPTVVATIMMLVLGVATAATTVTPNTIITTAADILPVFSQAPGSLRRFSASGGYRGGLRQISQRVWDVVSLAREAREPDRQEHNLMMGDHTQRD